MTTPSQVELVERVAKAIYNADGDFSDPSNRVAWERLIEGYAETGLGRANYRRMARAALSAAALPTTGAQHARVGGAEPDDAQCNQRRRADG